MERIIYNQLKRARLNPREHTWGGDVLCQSQTKRAENPVRAG